MLYTFTQLSEYLDRRNYPKINETTGFKILRTSFNEAYKEGKIEFREDGVYLTHEDKEWRGYMFMPTYRIEKYDSFPRIHLMRCTVIDKFLSRGIFNQYYTWSNSDTNDVSDRDTYQEYPDKNLNVCSRCKEMMFDDIEDSEDFFESLDKGEQQESQVEVDIFGYQRGWNQISKAFRKRKEYTCEDCGVQVEQGYDQRFLHVHHLKGKEDNRPENLRCLCILCHKYQDKTHEENFSNAHSASTIAAFIEKYGPKLNQSLSKRFLDSV